MTDKAPHNRTVTLSNAQYDAMTIALMTIARGHKTNICGNIRKLWRGDLMTEAREACDAAGLDWSTVGAD